MFSTIIFIITFVGLFLATIVLWALFLRLGLAWAKAPDITLGRVVFATAIVMLSQIAITSLLYLYPSSSDIESLVLDLVLLVVSVIIPCGVIRKLFMAPWLRAFQAWLPTLLTSGILLAFSHFVLQPYIFESFIPPTNPMAPTLLGQHWSGKCPQCGKPTYCTPSLKSYGPTPPPMAICDNFHVTKATDISKKVHSGDRFMVAKFLTPQRWDLVAFEFPANPEELFVHRIVGFPGEEILIQDGAVWVDGERLTPPDSIHGIEYTSETPNYHKTNLWGSANRPALLGEDEHFVLGDFSEQALDSRWWEQGAAGHNPFAVASSHIKGVVTHTFWPPNRWRIHR